MSGVKYLEELQFLQAENSPRGNQLANEKPTRGRFTPSSFQNAVYLSIFAESFPNGALNIAIILLPGAFRFWRDGTDFDSHLRVAQIRRLTDALWPVCGSHHSPLSSQTSNNDDPVPMFINRDAPPAKTSLRLPRKAKAFIGKEGCDGDTHPTYPHGYQATVEGHLPSKKKA
jgi:hypothetical protein